MIQETNAPNGLFAELRKLSPVVPAGCCACGNRRIGMGLWGQSTSCSPPWLFQSRFVVNLVYGPTSRWRMLRISQDELIEFLEVAMTMQGCSGEEWALKAYV